MGQQKTYLVKPVNIELTDKILHFPVDGSATWGDTLQRIVDEALSEVLIERKLTVACVIRNTGTGWETIDDGGHTPINVSSVSVVGNNIRIDHTPEASIVGTLLCVPDETFAVGGYNFGASVGANYSIISLYRSIETSGYALYNGASWDLIASKNTDAAAWVGAENALRITTDIPVAEFISSSLSCKAISRDGILWPFIHQVGTDYIDIGFNNVSGVRQTSESTDMKVFYSWNHEGQLKAANVESIAGNIWIYGQMSS